MKTKLHLALLGLFMPSVAMAGGPIDRMLKHVPDDAALVLAVPNIEGVFAGINAFGTATGIEPLKELEVEKFMSGPLGGHVQGVAWDAPLLVAMLPAVQFDPFLLVTMKDVDAWKNAAGAIPVDDTILRFTLEESTWFAAFKGDLGIMSRREDMVRQVLDQPGTFADRFKPQGGALLAKHHLVFWADVEKWQTIIQPAIGMAEGFTQMTVAMSDPQAEGSIAMWKWLFQQFRAIVEQSQVYAAGFHIGATGVFAEDIVTVKPDGDVAAYLGKVRPARMDTLRGLPAKPGMLTFAAEWQVPDDVTSFSECMLDAMFATPQGQKALADGETRLGIEASKRLYRILTGYNGSLNLSADGGIMITGLYLTDKPEKALAELRAGIRSMASAKMMNLFSSKLNMDIAHSVETLADRKIDAYTMTFETEDEEIGKAIRMVYGERPVFRVFAHDSGVGYTVGSGDSGKQALARMLASDRMPLASDQRIMDARNAIAANPQFSVFVDINALVRFGVDTMQRMQQLEQPPLVLAEQDDPLAAFGVYFEPNQMRSEFFLPSLSVRHVVEATEQHKHEDHDHGTDVR